MDLEVRRSAEETIRDFRHLYPFRHNYFDRGDYRMHYLDEGSGPPLVLLHGNPTWSFMYRRLVPALQDRFRVIVPDHLGCGLSDVPPPTDYPYTLQARVEDLGDLFVHLGLEGKIHLGMHDWGGVIGSSWAARNPDRTGALIVMNTAGFLMPGGKNFFWGLRWAHRSSLARFLILKFNAFLYGAFWLGCEKPLAKEVRRGFLAPYDTPYRRTAVLEFVRDIPLEEDHRSRNYLAETDRRLERLRGKPMLICWGMKDFVFDDSFLEEWQKRFPAASVETFSGAGHWLLEDAAPEIQAVIEDFLQRSGQE